MNGTCNGTIFLGPRPLGPWEEAKRSNIIRFQLLSQFQIFLNQTLCVFSQMNIQNILEGIFIRSPGSCHMGNAGGQNFNFLNMVMWHIKLKGMISRPGYNKKKLP